MKEKIESRKDKQFLLISTLIVVGGILPLLLYWFIYCRIEMITPDQAKQLLLAENSAAILIDIRTSEKYESAHIEGSHHWALNEVCSLESEEDMPSQYKGKLLLLICEGGINSHFAARHLKKLGVENAMNVRGGMQEWIGSVSSPEPAEFERFRSVSGEVREFPRKVSPLHEQVIAVASGFVIKPTYMLLSFVLAVLLWRKKDFDLKALRWAMVFFFLGESFCALNYVIYSERSYLFEYLHSFGMLLSFGFVTYAVLEGIDRRILKFSEQDKKCAALSLCGKCIKYEDVPCGLRRMFLLIAPVSILMAGIPLCADWHDTSYNTMIFSTWYNYSHLLINQQFELLYCPVAAIIVLTVSVLLLVFKKDSSLSYAKLLFAAGAAPLGFATFRSILSGLYSQNIMWFNFWEEATELMFIAGVCFVLWIFRQSLFRER